MRKITFNIKYDENFGVWGIMPDFIDEYRWEEFNPSTTGFTIAHDCLEHTRNESGEIWEEFQALGAMMLVRGRNWDWGYSSFESNIQADVYNELRNGFYGEKFIPTCDARIILNADEIDLFNDVFDEVKTETLKQIKSEAYDTEDAKEFRTYALDNWNKMVLWFQRGFTIAKQRYQYKNINVSSMFYNIQTCIDEQLKNYDLEHEAIYNNKLVLHYSEYEANLSIAYSEEDYY